MQWRIEIHFKKLNNDRFVKSDDKRKEQLFIGKNTNYNNKLQHGMFLHETMQYIYDMKTEKSRNIETIKTNTGKKLAKIAV